MEAAIRAFEDWEFRVLEQESGIDEEDDSTADKEKEGEDGGGMEKEILCQQQVVSTAQVMCFRGNFSENFTAAV